MSSAVGADFIGPCRIVRRRDQCSDAARRGRHAVRVVRRERAQLRLPRVPRDRRRRGDRFAARERPEGAILELRLGSRPATELVSLIHAASPETRIVISTAFACITSARWAILAGASAYLTKPVTTSQNRRGFEEHGRGGRATGVAAARWGAAGIHCEVLAHCGSIAAASRLLNIDRRSLRRMMARLGLDRNEVLAGVGRSVESGR